MAMNIDAAVNINADVNGQQAVDKLSESLKRMGTQGEASAKQVANAMRMVPAQLTDITTQLAGGQSPFLIMIQQGGQLRDSFGSVSGALLGVGRTLATLFTPINMVAAGIAALSFAAFRGWSQSIELNKQLLLTGSAAGYTAGQIEQMARALRDAQGISTGTARDITTGLAASGQFVGKNLDVAAEAIAKLEKLSGQTADEIVKDFARMSGGVASWAAEHNKQYNYLSLAQWKHIKQLEDMGKKEEAIRANIEALNEALEGRRRNLGYLESAWSSLGKAASWAWDQMLAIGRDSTPEEEIKELTEYIRDREKLIEEGNRVQPGVEVLSKRSMRELQNARNRLAELQKLTDDAQKKATEKAKDAAAIREQIDYEQSGKAKEAEQKRLKDQEDAAKKAEALRTANIQLKLAKLQGAADAAIAILDQEGQKVENKYRAGLITEQEYNDEKLRIAKGVLQERIKLSEKEQELEKTRKPKDQADTVQQQARIQALRNQAAQYTARQIEAELKAEGERAFFMRQMNDEVAKFARTQQARTDQIKMEADAASLSTLEYKKRAEAIRIDREAADAAKGKSAVWVAAINAEAEAQKKAAAEALDYADAKARSFELGARSAMKDYVESASNAANQAKTLFANAFKGMEDALVSFVKTGKLDFASLADSIISDLIRMAIQAQITAPLMQAVSGGLFGASPNSFFFANGGIMTAGGALPLNTYANGGIAKTPQMAIFGEGKTPEAYVPLPDGRHIPVAMRGDVGGSNVTVNVVNNAGGTQASAAERQDGNGNRIIDVIIEQVKASIAGDIARGTGTVTSALERTYGANRAAGAY